MSLRKITVLIGLALVALCPRALGQGAGLLDVEVEWDTSVMVGDTIRYSISVTNTSGQVLSDIFITNTFPVSFAFVRSTPDPVRSDNGLVVLQVGQLGINGTSSLSLDLRPTVTGTFTNRIQPGSGIAGQITGNPIDAVTTVTPAITLSDIAVSVATSETNVFVNDWIPITITFSNLGPSAISTFTFTDPISTNTLLRGYSPSNQIIISTNTLIFTSGSLAAGQSANIELTLQPTVAGTNFAYGAVLNLPSNIDTNTANNAAVIPFTVLEPVLGEIVVTDVGTQEFNRQNALVEQMVQVINVGSNSVPSARLVLTNIAFKVVNAVGTNDGNPFVVHGAPLQAGESVNLLLEYFIPSRTTNDPGFTAYSAGDFDTSASTNGSFIVVANTNIFNLPNRRILIQFPAERGATYQINYSTNMTFEGAMRARPSVVAQANWVQWIDGGPPKTLSHPTNEPMRFYRALKLP
ncbi:MAG: DUF11 domain-containing protein [Verrucomicrobia subdivision 3 bacterium]|nr:DUF11 domain-containing protein [Limisphaerales bacterium]